MKATTSNMNIISFFEIQSSEPQREVAFYSRVFGWKFELDKGLPFEYYHIRTQGIEGALLERPVDVPAQEQGTNAFTNLILVGDYDETHNIIMGNGGTIALPKFAVSGQRWQGYYLDPDNNVFGIFEIDENAA